MILGQNHHVIVPDTKDEVAIVEKVYSLTSAELDKDLIRIEMYGDDFMFGRNPDDLPPEPGVGILDDFTARVPTPPHELIKVFLPQFQIESVNRAIGNTASADLLNGTNGISSIWPDNVNGNIIVINYGLHDAKANIDIQTYKNNLISLRQGLAEEQILVWQTPSPTLTVNTAPYADAMIEVAAQFNDIVSDTRKISNWTDELPDGEYPRQLGYSRWVDLVLSEKINLAILKHLGSDRHRYYRLDYQEKFILDNQNQIDLSFTPLSTSWVEIYHRKNTAFYAVSRGNVDIITNPINNVSGHLAGGLHSIETGEQLVSVTNGYTLIKIRRETGQVIYHKTFNFEADIQNAKALATALNETSSDYIVVVTTYNEPKSNRLIFELADAMCRCGASTEIFGNPEFRQSAAYILIGIPGVGAGGGMEAYAGMIDNDRYAYCEIDFEIASNGVPYARDIFPPVAQIRNLDDEVIPLINPVYDLIAGVPPINGERILNPRYATFFTPGVTNETFVIQGNKIIFSSQLTGIVTVICDTQPETSANGVVINIDNIHNVTNYIHRFNPARWAPGKLTTTYPPAGTDPLSPPQVVSAAGVNALGLYNTSLAARVGDSFYCEPIVINQPNFGYVRITSDRKKMIYYPFPNYIGMDSFSYTLMTQHGQAGMTKAVYVKVTSTPVPTYMLTSNVNEIEEGGNVKITLTTTLISNGTRVPYMIYGVNKDDLVSQNLTGEFVVQNNQSILVITAASDFLTEGPEYLTLALTGVYPTKKIQIKIKDTSRTPVYRLTSNLAVANEGDVVRFTANANYVLDGTTVGFLITGISPQDIVQPLSGNFTFLSNVAYKDIQIARDAKTEGSETMTMSLIGPLPTVSNSVFITDTSLDPSYKLYSNINISGEGDTIKFYVETTEVQNGTTIPYVITGIQPDDILSPLSGNFTIQNHYAEQLITSRKDRTTEGPEVLVMSLQGIPQSNANVITTSVLINDTSIDPTYKLFSNVNVIDEGNSIKFYIQTTDALNGDIVPYEITGISSSDIVQSLSGVFSINNNYAETVITTREDRTTEGAETITFKISGVLESSANITSANVTINDTSLTPNYILSSNVSSVNEGNSVKFILSTSNVPNGEKVYYSIDNMTIADINQPLSGYFEINSNIGEVVITTKKDLNTEGDEQLTLSLDTISTVGNVTSHTVTVIDTSLSPLMSFTSNRTVMMESSTVKFTVTVVSQNVPDGTQILYSLEGLDGFNVSEDLVGSYEGPNYLTINNNQAELLFTTVSDRRTENTEILRVSILPIFNAVWVDQRSSIDVSVIDSSKGLTYSISFSASTIFEGASTVATIVCTGLFPGETINYSISGTNVGATLVTSAIGTLTPVNGIATLNIQTKIDGVKSGARPVMLYISGPGGSSASASFTLDDYYTCNNTISQFGTYTIDFGTRTGVIGINYDSYGAPDSYSLTWNGITRSGILRSGTGSLRITKTTAYPTTATFTMTSGSAGSQAEATIYCG